MGIRASPICSETYRWTYTARLHESPVAICQVVQGGAFVKDSLKCQSQIWSFPWHLGYPQNLWMVYNWKILEILFKVRARSRRAEGTSARLAFGKGATTG